MRIWPASLVRSVSIGLGISAMLASGGCSTRQPTESTYFSTTIAPTLKTACSFSQNGGACHVADAKGDAFGNLDVSSYVNVQKRADLLLNYGPFGQPALFIKNIPDLQLSLVGYDGKTTAITTDIKHSGGKILDPTDTAYQVLRQWVNNGATINNGGAPPVNLARQPCSKIPPPTSLGYNPNGSLGTSSDVPAFAAVNQVFNQICAASNCHGNLGNPLYLTCGNDNGGPLEAWNYQAAVQYLGVTGESSELARQPLNPTAGGAYHPGGVIFQTTSDPNYQAIVTWANAHGPFNPASVTPTPTPEFEFFAHNVQPMLVKKGCAMVQCHSPAMFHDYRLGAGAGGTFSYSTTLQNYNLTLAQVALEAMNPNAEDPNASRLIRKNIYPPANAIGGEGLIHRGASLFEDFSPITTSSSMDAGVDAQSSGTTAPPLAIVDGATVCPTTVQYAPPAGVAGTSSLLANVAQCPVGYYDAYYGSSTNAVNCVDAVPPYCVVIDWMRREYQARQPASATQAGFASMSGIVYVKRLASTMLPTTRPQDFDSYGPSDLILQPASVGTGGAIQTTGAGASLLSGCGLTSSADVRRPTVSPDGKYIAFAARTDANSPLQVYTMNADGSGCAPHTLINSIGPTLNSAPVHNFDPVFGPPDPTTGHVAIAFASTRGNLSSPASVYDYSGPQQTPADPTKWNANIYVCNNCAPGATGGFLTQITYLLNLERYPSFMRDGRLIMTAEKRAPNFYQLAGRRVNMDGSDYHPLYAQRDTIGYSQFTYGTQIADGTFVGIFSNQGFPYGGGVVGVANRSIGVDFTSTNPADYLVDPSVLDASALSYPDPAFFLRSLLLADGGSGNPTAPTTGVYTSPSPLPTKQILISYGAATTGTAFSGVYQIYVMDPATGAMTPLIGMGDNANAYIEAAAVYGKSTYGLFQGNYTEPNGFATISADAGQTSADILMLDMPMLASLLFQNTPMGRLVETGMSSVELYEDLPPPPGTTTSNLGVNAVTDDAGTFFAKRRLLGTVPLLSDGSSRFIIPGGLPVVFKLPTTSQSTGLPRFQREAMEFAPGEVLHQAFPRGFFNNLCGGCHGSVSGQRIDVAVQPDFISQASACLANTASYASTNLVKPPAQRLPILNPPFPN